MIRYGRERDTKRFDQEISDVRDLLLELGSDDWQDDLNEDIPIGSAIVPAEAGSETVHEEDEYDDALWANVSEEWFIEAERSAIAESSSASSLVTLQPEAKSQTQIREHTPEPQQQDQQEHNEVIPDSQGPEEELNIDMDMLNDMQEQENDLRENDLRENDLPENDLGFSVGFKTAGGKIMSEPSEAAVKRASRLLLSSPLQSPPDAVHPNLNQPDLYQTAFVTGRGAKLDVNERALKAATARLESIDAEPSLLEHLESPSVTHVVRKQLPAARQVHPLAQVQNVSAIDVSPSAPTTTSSSQHHAPVTNAPAPVPMSLSNGHAFQTPKPALRFKPPLKRPLEQPTPRAVSVQSSPRPFQHSHLHSHSQLSQLSQLSQFSQNKHTQTSSPSLHSPKTTINLQMPSMRRAATLTQRPRFIPPFKGGQRPSEADLQKNVMALRQRSSQALAAAASSASSSQSSDRQLSQLQQLEPTMTPVSKRPRLNGKGPQAVFDLKPRKDVKRFTWQEYGMQPDLSLSALRAFNLPNDVVFADATNTLDMRLMGQTGAWQGWQAAFTEIQDRGARLIDKAWVKNHWQLILWKLAGMIRAKPNELDHWWTFEHVVHQLLYRYEKEVNRAQRSAIKRIQEHDSPPGSPMILVVSRLFYDHAQLAAEGLDSEAAPVCVGLELTDGWYRINANVDSVLARAAHRGKLRIGTKMAITGANLDAPREGTDVLEAQNRSTLSISANSTCIARWDARLGFSKDTFVATLRSLSQEGGNASLLDLTILKMYPIGFREYGEENREKPFWNEVEEQARQAKYERDRFRAAEQVEQEYQEKLYKLCVVKDTLCSTLRVQPPMANFDADDFLEQLLEGKSKDYLSPLKLLSRDQAEQLKTTLTELMDHLQTNAQAEMTREVDRKCPTPNIGSFRVIRVVDSNPANNGFEGQITVYDALQRDSLVENGRYWVTNLKPSGGRWSKSTAPEGEVFLVAGKASHFTRRH